MKLYKVLLDQKVYWALYSDTGVYQDIISHYLIYCVDDLELNDATIRARAYVLKRWMSHVAIRGKQLHSANNDFIRLYRDQLLSDCNPNISNNLQSRQRTINQYLKIIYDFYHWMQLRETGNYILGPSEIYNIRSSLTVKSRKKDEREMYPLLFRRTASKSKHRTTYTPDYDTFLALYRHFIASGTPDSSERNCLILKIAFEAGLRVGSIASLKVDDFDVQKIQASNNSYIITPAVQKFGKQNSFEISISLAMDIIEYIEGARQRIVQRTNATSSHIFLSGTNGKPILSTSISSAFSKASKLLGLPYRAGIHSWRGLFAENLIDYEIDARQELGFDTSVESIGMVVAKALGHSNPLSQQNYIRSMKTRHRSSQAFKHLHEVSSLRDQLLESMKEAELLRKLIFEFKAKSS